MIPVLLLGLFFPAVAVVHVPMSDGTSPDLPGLRNDVWYLPLTLGQPEVPLAVLFDTGSALAWIRRSTPGCNNTSPYSPLASTTSVDTNDEMHFVYGEGPIDGKIYEDSVTLGDATLQLPWGWVTTPSGGCFDGLIGADMESTLLSAFFTRTGTIPRFGLAGPGPTRANNAVTLGGVDMSTVQGGLACVPTVLDADRSSPGQGATTTKWWQLAVSGGVTVEGIAVPLPSGLQVIVDTGCGEMNGSPSVVAKLLQSIGVPPDGDCTGVDALPSLTFHLADGVAITFGRMEYTAQIEGRCKVLIQGIPGLSDDWFVFGAPLWWKYYTAFDYASGSVGFGLLSNAAGEPLPNTCRFDVGAEVQLDKRNDGSRKSAALFAAATVSISVLFVSLLSLSRARADPSSFRELPPGPCP